MEESKKKDLFRRLTIWSRSGVLSGRKISSSRHPSLEASRIRDRQRFFKISRKRPEALSLSRSPREPHSHDSSHSQGISRASQPSGTPRLRALPAAPPSPRRHGGRPRSRARRGVEALTTTAHSDLRRCTAHFARLETAIPPGHRVLRSLVRIPAWPASHSPVGAPCVHGWGVGDRASESSNEDEPKMGGLIRGSL